MAQIVKDIVTWLQQWFYTESEVDTMLSGKVNVAQGSGNGNKNVVTDSGGAVTLEAKPTIDTALSSSSTNAVQNKVINTALSNKADKTGGVAQVTDGNAHSNLGTSANATQSAINNAIDTAIGNLASINAINIVDTLPTASASTMGKLYIISENSKVNVYYTKQSGTSYAWQKMDTDILDEFSVSWSDVTNKPFTSVDTAITNGSNNPVTNGAISTALSTKSDKTATVGTTITLANVGETNEGCIIFNTVS